MIGVLTLHNFTRFAKKMQDKKKNKIMTEIVLSLSSLMSLQ